MDIIVTAYTWFMLVLAGGTPAAANDIHIWEKICVARGGTPDISYSAVMRTNPPKLEQYQIVVMTCTPVNKPKA